MPLLLNEREIRELLPTGILINLMDEALARFSARNVVQPVRTILEVAQQNAFFGTMPVYDPETPALGAKLVTVFPNNLESGMDSHQATILLLNPTTGLLDAILDGRYITEMRTAAVSAVSVKKLARRAARTLAIIGSGVQARSHVEAIREVANIVEIRSWSPTRSRLEAFAQAAGAVACESAEAAVRNADIVVTVTASREPVIRSEWVAPGTHVIAVGSCRPNYIEIDPALMRRARVFVDSRDAAQRESGDIIHSGCEVVAELGEPQVRRESPGEITLFKSLGLAIEDLVAGQYCYEQAIVFKKGTHV